MLKTLTRHILNNYFLFILLIIVCLSFGQLLWMQPWQDDNALIFKILNIEEAAGFLGKGIFGEGPYRYTATLYYFLYRLVGLNIISLYALALVFYFFSAIAVFYLFKNLLGIRAGMIASFLYAANYATSDSFIRLFNSVSSSTGVIFLSIFISTYWKFYKTKKIYFYFLSLIVYFLTCELLYVRFHYLFGFVIVMDLLLNTTFSLRSIFNSFLRLIPFSLIFLWLYIINGDNRSGNAITNLYNIVTSLDFFSLFSGFGQLIFPDRVLLSIIPILSFITINPYYQIIIACIVTLIFFNIVAVIFFKKNIFLIALIFFLSFIGLLASRRMFQMLPPSTSFTTLFVGYVGMIFYLGFFFAGLVLKNEKRKLLFLFLFLSLISIFSYIVYDSTLFYGTYNNRYLVHSYIGLIGIVTVLVTFFKNKIFTIIVISIGLLSLIVNINYQYEIIQNRSKPIEAFYDSLKIAIPSLNKGSVIYIDVEQNPKILTQYSDAITSSQMPETTAIAWRYGLDRYDFDLVTNYTDFQKIILEKNIKKEDIHSFFYGKKGLVNTTTDLFITKENAKFINKLPLESNVVLSIASKNTIYKQEEIYIPFKPVVSSVLPTTIDLTIVANLVNLSSMKFPVIREGVSELLLNYPEEKKDKALSYKKYKENYLKMISYKASDSWRENKIHNINDLNYSTYWQPDRVIWSKQNASVTIDLKEIKNVNRLVWVNGFSDNTPTDYKIETSTDGFKWVEVQRVKNSKRLASGEWSIINFKPQEASFIKVIFTKTLNEDAPAIVELWPIPTEYEDLDLINTEEFIKNPLDVILDEQSFSKVVNDSNSTFKVRYYWLSDKSDDWQSNPDSFINIIYDGLPHNYTIKIPPGGMEIKSLKLSEFEAPGILFVNDLNLRNEIIKYETK